MVRLRILVRERVVAVGFSLIDQTKVITAASELARNTVTYGGGGESHIADVALALTDGYTTGNGLGLGLSGAKRLSDQFEISSTPGQGTTVVITKWKRF